MKMNVYLEPRAYMPERGHNTDAGLDLRSRESFTIKAGDAHVFDTGIHVGIPKGTCGVLVSKSGLNTKFGLLSTGLIDEGYTGSICVKLYNLSENDYHVSDGDKISQLVILPCIYADAEQIEFLDDLYDGEVERGDNGFGSTGK